MAYGGVVVVVVGIRVGVYFDVLWGSRTNVGLAD
jgi:hypothetical protein